MPLILESDRLFLAEKLHLFCIKLHEYFSQPLLAVLGLPRFVPEELQQLFSEIDGLQTKLDPPASGAEDFEITDVEAALLRQAILRSRLAEARSIEEKSLKTFHAELLDHLWSGVRAYDTIMSREWFCRASDRRLPKLTDFLPIEYAQAPIWQTAETEPRPREFDEKFHILQAPTFFIRDLEEFREAAELRALSFAVAFIDIDYLKSFNEKYTETVVDREVLPVVMRCMEAHLYKRGYAYRQGGDEYMVLVYNTPSDEANVFIDALRRKIEQLVYRGIERRITVSIGLVCGDAECHFTSREVEAKASKAKAFAKEKGRNCIATYKTMLLAESDLYIAN